MANTPFKLHHSTPAVQLQSRSKPSAFFCKFFIIVLVLLTITLFPSQAPQFTTFSSLFTKLYEPLQLLFVGLAVCYGLFCKRSTTKFELKNEASDLDYSEFLDMSSFFEDGFQNSCGYDEKRLILKCEEKYKLDEGKGVRSMNLENGSKKKDVLIGVNITKGWNSKYFPGEPTVVVANGDCVVDEWAEPMSKREYKPLNLPVRSLRSSVIADKYEENGTTEGEFSSDGPLKIRGVRPMNLEKKFEEVSSPAPGCWQTRSCMMDMKEEKKRHRESSHLRPHSAGEFDFDRLQPNSAQYPLSRNTSSECSSHGEFSPSQMKMEDMDPYTDLKSPHMNVSVPKIASEGTFMASKSLHSSFGHSLDMNLQRNNIERFKESNQIKKVDNFNGEKQGGSYVISEAKSDKISRVLRGKSVRTIRSCKVVPYEMRGSNTEESNAGDMYIHTQDLSFLNLEGHENPEVPKILTANDKFPGQVMELPESQSEVDDPFETRSITSRDDSISESESESYSSSPDEEVARSDIEGSEVDRKAGEFIAKFREQIRLQKLASAKKPSHSDVS